MILEKISSKAFQISNKTDKKSEKSFSILKNYGKFLNKMLRVIQFRKDREALM